MGDGIDAAVARVGQLLAELRVVAELTRDQRRVRVRLGDREDNPAAAVVEAMEAAGATDIEARVTGPVVDELRSWNDPRGTPPRLIVLAPGEVTITAEWGEAPETGSWRDRPPLL